MSESQQIIKQEQTRFTSDSQLLSELGERLIATSHVALAELIKNAYDADATRCNIWINDNNSALIIKDNGHGMTEAEFKDFWMTIATSNRDRNPTSRRYSREVQGSKGVGRFAVRNLGLFLELRTIAYYEEADEYRRLIANFDWEAFESGTGLQEMEVSYRIEASATAEEEGTTLRISDLQDEWTEEELEEVSAKVLDIVSAPYESSPSEIEGSDDEDPGFNVYFAPPGKGSPRTSVAQEIYERYVAKVEITVDGQTLIYEYDYEGGESRTYKYELDENLVGDIEGEIRWIPRRKGVLAGMRTADGRKARSWLSENGGIRIVDNNFRMPPYGDQGDDWLGLSQAQARRSRNWESPITEALFPEGERKITESQAMLQLPRKVQVLGAIHVSSYRSEEIASTVMKDRLMPSMDRQGFVENDAYEQLVDITRGSLEILGVIDRLEEQKQKKKKAEEKKDKTTSTISSTKEFVQESDDIGEATQQELLDQVEDIEIQVEEHHEAEKEAREAVESMNLLGVVSAFMSHETTLILDSAKDMLDHWKQVPPKDRSDEFQDRIEHTEQAVEDFETHLSYSQAFVEQISSGSDSSFKPKPQVNMIIEKFERYTERREIEVENAIRFGLETPEVNVGLYSGVLINLYTNAIKAVVEDSIGDDGRKIRFEAENTSDWHKVRVIDNGVGISKEERTRIFEPMYSTTDVEGPTSVGSGLGLYIVKQVVERVGGKISLVDSPDEFETAFEVRLTR
ncbi:sensor histidine kinase [Halocatena salina]|uniref:histidine kinase n=1 Tax=Halocatena salina TaxID=2934340 RepID=A0A8U0A207_9EURY|nr:ATP-binding protein [Halocatena salina]UPM43180.1 ATP-binding protein [Halocatena salina]